VKINSKEKKEIALVIGAVLIVAVLGIVLMVKTNQNVAGAATTRISNLPDNTGVLSLLNEKCVVVSGKGSCDLLCGQNKVCLPLEENCDTSVENNRCYCCED